MDLHAAILNVMKANRARRVVRRFMALSLGLIVPIPRVGLLIAE